MDMQTKEEPRQAGPAADAAMVPAAAGAPKESTEEGSIDPAEAAAAAAAEEAAKRAEEAAWQERWEHEEAVLKEAAAIRDRRGAARVPPHPEPKHGKTHWDHLLNEMAWLSKEFQKERKWKLQSARKYASAVQRSNLDLESRVVVRAREEEKAIRRRAAWIAREVAAFWGKAQRVVAFKVRTESEARKKVVLDKQLDALLGQTQKYSSMLAQRLTVEERAEAVAEASKPAEPAAEAAAGSKHANGSGPAAFAPSSSPAPQPPQQQQPAAAAVAVRAAGKRPVAPSLEPSSAAVSGTDELLDEGDEGDEYRSGEDDDADDEETLEEEERKALAEGDDVEKEVAGLEDDADLPLEQLLAQYGYVIPEDGTQQPASPGPSAAAAPPKAAGRAAGRAAGAWSDAESESDQLAMLLEEMPPGVGEPTQRPSRLAAEFAALSEGEGEAELEDMEGVEAAGPSSPAAAARRRAGAASRAGARGVGAGGADDDEYRSGEDDDADDEATLEEEERKAQAELGADFKKEEAEEVAGLEGDAELPLDELLARYGYTIPGIEEAAAGGAEAGPSAAVAQQPAERAAPAAAVANGGGPDANGSGGEDEEGGEGEGGDIAYTMEEMAAAQPTGHTLATARVKTPVPFLLKGQLREYQHIGLDWLVTLYHKRLNGILADEMGLGKTIQTIALLAWLACERGDWGPHLVVVPTSVMLNWEMEFKRWAPAFKLLTYYGSPKERAAKRQGWSKPNAFHVCITSYTIVLADARMFRRKKWKYLILDEAHMIKNWRSQRWQTLLNFNSKRRLLITGTPLQNDLMELWSLMHFLMPQVFGSHSQFKDWFSNPMTGMVEGSAEYNRAIVERLHAVLRPFLLRRMKRDVEKQLPGKHEHVVYCRLSKRQRQLYEEYMASGDTRATMASGNFLGIINCLMQLRKVCNHPDLFEGRPIVSAFDMQPLQLRMPSAVVRLLGPNLASGTFSSSRSLLSSGVSGGGSLDRSGPDLAALGLMPVADSAGMGAWEAKEVGRLALALAAFAQPATTPQEDVELLYGGAGGSLVAALGRRSPPSQAALAAVAAAVQALVMRRRLWRKERTAALGRLSASRSGRALLVGADILSAAHVEQPAADVHAIAARRGRHLDTSHALRDMVKLPERRAEEMDELLRAFVFVIPKARAPAAELWCSHPDASAVAAAAASSRAVQAEYSAGGSLLHTPRLRTQLFFPDRRLLQYDCGKLQELAALLARLKAGGHRALIFTQMSKMLDILEAFLNLHAFTYVRLDGATKPEQRQALMQRFNTDTRIFTFILSTRSGGVGMNLTGADTVIFYDSDWNPAMDAQAQDRCHRIGQTREVHIYRLVSEHTIEENILKKSDQKRHLDFLAIQSGGFTTEFLQRFDPKAILGIEAAAGAPGTSAAAAAAATVGGAGVSEEAIRAAMRAAEDEGDAAAAAAVEQEAAAEMDEFTKEPPPPTAGAGGEGNGEEGEAATEVTGEGEAEPSSQAAGPSEIAPAIADIAAEDETMAEVAALAGGGAGGDALAHLEGSLRPIERYAVRFVESEAPAPDPEALAAQVEAVYRVDEFDVDAIEAAEEEREAEIDEDEEANLVADWDQGAATAAYAQQVQAAEAAERQREEAEAAWLAQYGLQYGLVDAVEGSAGTSLGGSRGGRRGRGASRLSAPTASVGWEEERDTAMSPRATWLGDSARHRWPGSASDAAFGGAPPHLPWQPQEDLVLCSVVALLLEQGQLPGSNLWTAATDALGAGAAATSVTGVGAAARQGEMRSAQACAQRYGQLRAAFEAAAPTGGKGSLAAALGAARGQLAAALGAAALPGPAHTALLSVYHVLQQAAAAGVESPAGAQAQALLHALRSLRAQAGAAAPEAPPAAAGQAPAGPLAQAQGLVAAVRAGCGPGAARVISGRLPTVLGAAQCGGAAAAREALQGAAARPAEVHRPFSPPSPRSPRQPAFLLPAPVHPEAAAAPPASSSPWGQGLLEPAPPQQQQQRQRFGQQAPSLPLPSGGALAPPGGQGGAH